MTEKIKIFIYRFCCRIRLIQDKLLSGKSLCDRNRFEICIMNVANYQKKPWEYALEFLISAIKPMEYQLMGASWAYLQGIIPRPIESDGQYRILLYVDRSSVDNCYQILERYVHGSPQSFRAENIGYQLSERERYGFEGDISGLPFMICAWDVKPSTMVYIKFKQFNVCVRSKYLDLDENHGSYASYPLYDFILDANEIKWICKNIWLRYRLEERRFSWANVDCCCTERCHPDSQWRRANSFAGEIAIYQHSETKPKVSDDRCRNDIELIRQLCAISKDTDFLCDCGAGVIEDIIGACGARFKPEIAQLVAENDNVVVAMKMVASAGRQGEAFAEWFYQLIDANSSRVESRFK